MPREPEVVRRKRIETECRWYRDNDTGSYGVWRYGEATNIYFDAFGEIDVASNPDDDTWHRISITFAEAAAILTARGQDPYVELENAEISTYIYPAPVYVSPPVLYLR